MVDETTVGNEMILPHIGLHFEFLPGQKPLRILCEAKPPTYRPISVAAQILADMR
jgi:hypothetical protein